MVKSTNMQLGLKLVKQEKKSDGIEGKLVRFTLLNPDFIGWAFNGYPDANGNAVFLQVNGLDGVPTKYYVHFESRTITVPAANEDLLEFIREAPWCLGSDLQKNGGYAPYYQEVDSEKAAREWVDTTTSVMQALKMVLDLSAKDLRIFAFSIGCMDDSEMVQRQAAMQYASSHPSKLIERLGSAKLDTTVRAAFEFGVKKGILKYENGAYKYNERVLGGSVDAAVATIKNDDNLRKYLTDILNGKAE